MEEEQFLGERRALRGAQGVGVPRGSRLRLCAGWEWCHTGGRASVVQQITCDSPVGDLSEAPSCSPRGN